MYICIYVVTYSVLLCIRSQAKKKIFINYITNILYQLLYTTISYHIFNFILFIFYYKEAKNENERT